MPDSSTPVEVFYSYAHKDEAFRNKLETHLSLLQRQGLITAWHDRHILPGTDWSQAIDEHLERASVILLLISADFLASDYCYGIEMQRALERHQANEARVIPILLRPVDWKSAPFAHLQALPTGAKPITTWSNRDAAFTDVAAGIRRVIEDLSSLAASAPRAALPPVWNVPYPRNSFFIGRDELLERLHTQLQAGQATALSQPHAIIGLGGIGKTQIAVEYAYRFHQDYQVVLWARAESTEALTSSYVTIASLLNLPEQEAQEQEITVQAVKVWLQRHSGWLLILDNADDLSLVPAFLPPALGSHLLLTTRAFTVGHLASRLEVNTLSPEQGALFLLRRASLIAPDATLEQVSPQQRDLAMQVSQELGGLPLALDQAGAYLEATGTSLAAYQQIYQRHRMDLLAQRRAQGADHPEPVASTWSLSFVRVEAMNSAAADLLRLCAYLAPDAIAEEILTQGAEHLGPVLGPVAADVFLLGQAIEALRAYSLINRDPSLQTLTVHRLVQAVVRDALEEAERRCWAERTVLAVNAVFPANERGTWQQCERLLPHALLAAHLSETYQLNQADVGRLLYETASYLQHRARYHEAESLYQHSLRIREQALGPAHPEVAHVLNNLAELYREQGKYEQAEPLFQRSLRIREQALGSAHPEVARVLNNLADLYRDQGKYEQAESLYQRSLRIREQALGSAHPEVAHALSNLAKLYYKQGKYEQAEPLYQRSLQIREQALGSAHPEVARVLNNLADLYRDQGKYEQAESLYQRALRIREQQLGPEHLLVAYPLNGLANLYKKQGKYAEAEPLYLHALRIREQQLGPEHLLVAEVMYDFAFFQETKGNMQEALSLYQRALVICERVLGPHHPKTRGTQECVLSVLRELGRHEETVSFQAMLSEPIRTKEEQEKRREA